MRDRLSRLQGRKSAHHCPGKMNLQRCGLQRSKQRQKRSGHGRIVSLLLDEKGKGISWSSCYGGAGVCAAAMLEGKSVLSSMSLCAMFHVSSIVGEEQCPAQRPGRIVSLLLDAERGIGYS